MQLDTSLHMDVKYLTLTSDSDQEKYHEVLSIIEHITHLPKSEQITLLQHFKKVVEEHETASPEVKQAAAYTFNCFLHIGEITNNRSHA